MTPDDLYKAWHAVGADIAGLKFSDFVKHLPAKQQQQVPVAWMRPSEEGYNSAFRDHSTVARCTGNPWTGWVPLYTSPPQRKPLTDEHLINMSNMIEFDQVSTYDFIQFARAIEAAHGITNN